jgi:hypothetical protein
MVLQAQVGHLSAAMTKHYCHISDSALHRAAKQIEANSSALLSELPEFWAYGQQSEKISLGSVASGSV